MTQAAELYEILLVHNRKLITGGLTETEARAKCREINRDASVNEWVTWERHRSESEPPEWSIEASDDPPKRSLPMKRNAVASFAEIAPGPVQGPPSLKRMEDFLQEFADLPALPKALQPLESFPCDPILGALLPGERPEESHYIPTPEELADTLAAIRAEWSPLEAYRRRRGITPDDPKMSPRGFVPRVFRFRRRAA